ncbi:hypothetical protein HN011_003889 [Eciton burchellii]|nr:hypothetical protein HN011_003889 [Eciton burchellii]
MPPRMPSTGRLRIKYRTRCHKKMKKMKELGRSRVMIIANKRLVAPANVLATSEETRRFFTHGSIELTSAIKDALDAEENGSRLRSRCPRHVADETDSRLQVPLRWTQGAFENRTLHVGHRWDPRFTVVGSL